MGKVREGRKQSAARSVELWRRWRAGESTREIASAVGCNHGTVSWAVRYYGGIEPAQRVRAAAHLSLAEREEISRGLAVGEGVRAMARRLRRPASTISREISRNGGRCCYRAESADRAAWRRGERPKAYLFEREPTLREVVSDKLGQKWSPQQIARWLREQPDNGAHMQVSHETIYRGLFVQCKATLKQELTEHLRSGRKARRTHSRKDIKRGQILGAVSISQRPPEAADRAIPGHWEGDLIAGANNSWVVTLVERRSRYAMLAKIGGKDSTTVVDAMIDLARRLPEHMMKTLTWDRGTEMAQHARFTVDSGVQVYFCDPHSPWQRGTNENTNGLLRQYLKRKDDLTVYTQDQLDRIAAELNNRPRMTLNWQTPAKVLNEALQASGVALTS